MKQWFYTLREVLVHDRDSKLLVESRLSISSPADHPCAWGLAKAEDVRRFTISIAGSSGWKVREEENSPVLREICYDDWRCVARALLNFTLAAASLVDAGWVEG